MTIIQFRRIGASPVPAVLEMADRILGSLFPILNVLEPVKEFKETLESRLKNDGDAGLQSLNIDGLSTMVEASGKRMSGCTTLTACLPKPEH
jgi:hypothetical protein